MSVCQHNNGDFCNLCQIEADQAVIQHMAGELAEAKAELADLKAGIEKLLSTMTASVSEDWYRTAQTRHWEHELSHVVIDAGFKKRARRG